MKEKQIWMVSFTSSPWITYFHLSCVVRSNNFHNHQEMLKDLKILLIYNLEVESFEMSKSWWDEPLRVFLLNLVHFVWEWVIMNQDSARFSAQYIIWLEGQLYLKFHVIFLHVEMIVAVHSTFFLVLYSCHFVPFFWHLAR